MDESFSFSEKNVKYERGDKVKRNKLSNAVFKAHSNNEVKYLDDLSTFSQIERGVLRITEEIVRKGQVIKIGLLQRMARKKLNFPFEEIDAAIYQLILKKVIVPEKRLTKMNVMANEKRQQILDYVNEQPGAHLRELREQLNLNPHVANWHLKVLESFNLIRRRKYLKYRVYFPADFNKSDEEPLLALKNDKALRIFLEINENPQLSFDELRKLSDQSPKVIRYHLDRLKNSGIVDLQEKDGEEFFVADEYKFESIQKYLKVEMIERKEAKPIPEAPVIPDEVQAETPPAPESTDLINVKREYDHVGGGIRFKVAVQNVSKMVVTDINVTLIPTSQFDITDRVQIIKVLKPDESRGVDFNLIPFTCGKSKVFGSASYFDPFGNPHTFSITPKDIWIKCPLVQPKKSSLIEIEKLKKELQKGIARIPFTINSKSAFDIVHDQISVLDLSEITVDDEHLLMVYSGVAKVTNDNMIIEAKIESTEMLITVWTHDMKQATGFLAYLKNLVQMSYESYLKLEGKIEKISQKVLDANDIIRRFSTLTEYCEEDWNVGDILLLLKEIESKIQRSNPSSSMIEKIKDWIEDLQTNYREGESLSDNDSTDLEYQAIEWLTEMNRVCSNNLEIYQETFPEQDLQIEQLCNLTEHQDQLMTDLITKYSKRIIQYLMIINKATGLTLFEFNFASSQLDADLISGFLTAVQSFGSEIAREDSAMTKLAYKKFQIQLEDGEYATTAIMLKGKPTAFIVDKLKTLITEFESRYREHLVDFSGAVGVFRSAREIIENIFE